MIPVDEFRITFPQLLRLNSDRFWHGVVGGLCLFAAALGIWSATGGRPPVASTPAVNPPSSPVSAPGAIPALSRGARRGSDLPSSLRVDDSPSSAVGDPSVPQPIAIAP